MKQFRVLFNIKGTNFSCEKVIDANFLYRAQDDALVIGNEWAKGLLDIRVEEITKES